jgi:hypothetical protein
MSVLGPWSSKGAQSSEAAAELRQRQSSKLEARSSKNKAQRFRLPFEVPVPVPGAAPSAPAPLLCLAPAWCAPPCCACCLLVACCLLAACCWLLLVAPQRAVGHGLRISNEHTAPRIPLRSSSRDAGFSVFFLVLIMSLLSVRYRC